MSDKLKKSRTVRLTPELDSRLLALCDHLGTNPNAYLVTEIGKAISRDEVAFKAVQGSSDTQAQMLALVQGFAADMASADIPASR
jgi:hypothetical protein